MIDHSTQTIAAVATPPGHGAVGIIRVSGLLAREAVSAHFVSSRRNFSELKPYHLHHGHFLSDSKQTVDEVLVAFMPGPGSFTGEDVVEINCHGSPVVLQSVLETLLAYGIHPAGPGEFTQRAFLNGRMDLTQAEAVAEIISATSPAASLMAQNKLSGNLRNCLQDLRTRLEELRAQLCLAVDFPEEEMECLAPVEFLNSIAEIRKQIHALLQNHEQNRIWNDGALCVLSGAVNAGKSSLLNLLLGRQRAIVSSEPGTTRDYIEERIFLHGLSVRLIDTAGSRHDADSVEREGLSQARHLREQADLILLVADNSTAYPYLDFDQDERLQSFFPCSKSLVVANKSDLASADPEPALYFAEHGYEVVHISTKTGQGVDNLLQCILARLTTNSPEPGQDSLTPNLRQSQALHLADAELHQLCTDISNRLPYDLLGVHLESVSRILAEITGDISSEEILQSIFSRFCIGK